MDKLDSAWNNLQSHFSEIQNTHLKDQFINDKTRFKKFFLESQGLFLDYSKNLITSQTIELLLGLVEEVNLRAHIEKMFAGEIINTTEKRAVLHTALRNPDPKAKILVAGENVIPMIQEVLHKMEACVNSVQHGKWKGYNRKVITDVVNIGIGGSDLGPHMVTEALKPYAESNINCHFVSNVDGTHISETLKLLNPETTLFIIASKTFTTQETLCNAVTAKEWLLSQVIGNYKNVIKHHFIAVTAKPDRAVEFGIAEKNIFPFWDWVGGRYSLWSAIGLSIAMAIGMNNYKELLAGAHAMDEHFRDADFAQNMPVILALLGIWNINFWGCATQAIIPYDQYLLLLPAFLQQLDMESNGKHVTINGTTVKVKTAPVLWGSVGTNGQHAFHQLLLQGTQTVPVDFIISAQTHNPIGEHHLLLYANCLAQSQALMLGKSEEEVIAELRSQGMSMKEAKLLAPHKVINGNIPSNTILLEKLTPFSLGSLIALYEHKVFVQGIIWGINSFDQWGVELGKKIAGDIIPQLQEKNLSRQDQDCSTQGLIQYYHEHA